MSKSWICVYKTAFHKYSHSFIIVLAMVTICAIHPIVYGHPCKVVTTLHASSEEVTEDIGEFSIDLVSPVEYLFRKFSAKEFGKPPYSRLTFLYVLT